MPMLKISLPIFRKKYNAQQQESKHYWKSSELKYENTMNQLQAEYIRITQQLEDAARKIDLYQKQYDLSLATYQLIVREFSTGRTTLTDVIQVELGPSLGNSYVILNGLREGEEIVTNGVFAIDASAQLEGKTSMMNNGNEPAKPMIGHEGHMMHAQSATGVASEHAMFGVKGSCDMCKERIEKAAKGVNGVLSAHWDKDTQMIHLQYEPQKTSPKAISKAIAKVGHDTDMDKADKAVYDKLPACCHYR